MKKIRRLIPVICLLYCTQSKAQQIAEPVKTPTIFPSTPQSQLFEKYINHTVTEYNGLPDINIPLYTVEIKGVKIPITLSYHASGIKYKGYDGDIAAGWSLSAGGYRITRTIRGKADELFPLYNENSFWGLQGLEQSAYMASVGQEFDVASKMFTITGDYTMRDGEYDQFNYMLPASSGQFLISDRNTKAIDMANPRQDKIILDEGVAQLKLDNIKVIDNAGVQYFAGGLQNNVPLVELSRSNNFYKTAWPVSRIVTPENESVNFTYKKYSVDMADENYYTYKMIDATRISVGGSSWFRIADPEEQFDVVEEMYFVDKIQTDKEKVEFIRQAGSHVLNKIIVTGLLDNKVITIDFGYSDDGEHRLLTNLLVNGKPYSFDYYDPPADLNNTFADQWGYYKTPDAGSTHGDYWGLYFHKEFLEHSFYEYINLPGTSQTIAKIKDRLNQILPNFVDREENTNISYYSLKTIYFPTGGATVYEYEPHKYNKSIFRDPHGPFVEGGGQRVKKITSIAGVGSKPVVTFFKYGINENGLGKVDADYLDNIKNKFFNEIVSYDMTTYGAPNNGFRSNAMTTVRTYSPKPMDADVDFECPVEYEQVTTYQYDEANNTTTGKTVSNYDVPYRYSLTSLTQATTSGLLNNPVTRVVYGYMPGQEPTLRSRKYYRNSDEIKREEFTYTGCGSAMYYGVKCKQKAFFDVYPSPGVSILRTDIEALTGGHLFEYAATFLVINAWMPASKTTTITENGVSLVTSETYEYNSRNQLSKTATTDSKNNFVTKEYTYPSAALGGIYVDMENRNILSPVIKEITKRGNKELFIKKTNFSNDPSVTTGLILPRSVQTSYTGEPNLRDDLVYERYDNEGNPLQYVAADGIKVAAVWGYNQLEPIAQVLNAEAKNVFHTSFEDADGNMPDGKTGRKSRLGGYAKALSNLTNGTYVLSWWQKNGSAWELQVNTNISVTNGAYTINLAGQVDEVRFYPAGAQMTTYTYDPLIGITSECDARNKASYYTYDGFGRLQHIRDQDNNIIKSFDYNYTGQPLPVYTSTQSRTYTAPCTVGGIPSSYTYTTTGISLISSQDAYNKAIDDINLHGQSEANPTFFCTYWNDDRTAWLQRTGCDEGLVGTWGLYWVKSGKYRSYVSKADANAMADAEINAKGSTSVGECVPPYVSATGFNWGPSGCYQIEFWDPSTGFSLWYNMENGNNDLPRLPINTVDLQVVVYPIGTECDGVERTYTVTCDGVTQSYTTSGIHLFHVSLHDTFFISIQ